MHKNCSIRGPFLLVLVLLVAGNGALWAQSESYRDQHPLELRALLEPDAVIAELATHKARAESAGDVREQARLALAEANACRVKADWFCQRRAGHRAAKLAAESGDAYLEVRGLIVAARGHAAMQDFNAAELSLGEASSRLRELDEPALSADVALAYSSISASLGKSELAVGYARRGLQQLPVGEFLPLRVRLLRNLAKSAIDLRRFDEAQTALTEAQAVIAEVEDPKLRGEIWLEYARMALNQGDAETAERMAQLISVQGERLKNSQLTGLSLEVEARAALLRKNTALAETRLISAAALFRALDLYRDELRVVRLLTELQAERDGETALLASVNRLNQLSDEVSRREREVAADDFDDRLRYVQQEAELEKANARAETDRLRVESAQRNSRLSRGIAVGTALAGLLLGVLYLLLRRTTQALRRVQAERANVVLRVSHDLRNPLNGILGACAALESRPLGGGERQLVESIAEAAKSMVALAQDLLDQGQLERGKLRLEPNPVDLAQSLTSFAELYARRAEAQGLAFALSLPAALPARVMIDRHRLQQVLGNLLGNALKFTRIGKISLLINVSARDENSVTIEFSVADTGPGIAASDQARMFRPFEKGIDGQQNSSGAGLGLAISANLVELMGGRLQLDSEPGRGARFTFSLTVPIVPEPPAAATPVHAKGLYLSPVLMVDDDPLNREFHALLLDALDIEAGIAESPSEAMALAKSKHFAACLLDYELPEMNGVELAERLRKHGGESARMIILSGHPPSADLGRDRVDDWVIKPTSLDRLREVLRAS